MDDMKEALVRKLDEAEMKEAQRVNRKEVEPRAQLLCIFLQTGKTFTFKDVKVLVDNESVLQFGYKAMSDGKLKVATFLKTMISGWSITW